jgi:hypothetical protein
VLSRTYRLSSANEAAAMKLDPENKLYWRMNSQRLDAEALRDFLLAISGELAYGIAFAVLAVFAIGGLVAGAQLPDSRQSSDAVR